MLKKGLKERIDNMSEIWKDVVGYEGYYQVSDLGRIRSLDRVTCGKHITGKIITQRRTRGGYLFVSFYRDGAGKHERVNRVVATAFIDNPEQKPHAGHLNDIKTDNRSCNLYWTDASENTTHNGRHLRVGKKIGKPIIGVKGDETVMFISSLDAARHGFNASAIRNCVTGIAKRHRGYEWKRATECRC